MSAYISVCIHICTYMSAYLLTVYIPVCLPVCPLVCCLSVCLHAHLSAFYACVSVCLRLCLHTRDCQSAYLSDSECVPAYLSDSECVSACLTDVCQCRFAVRDGFPPACLQCADRLVYQFIHLAVCRFASFFSFASKSVCPLASVLPRLKKASGRHFCDFTKQG